MKKQEGFPVIKLKDPPLSKRKSTLSTMGLLCFCFVGLGCSLKAPKYIIDIDRLTDTAPETSDKRLKEMVSVQLVHEDKYGNHDDVVEEWLVGKVSFRRYELMEEPPNEFGARTQIDIHFNHFERTYKFFVMFNEFVAHEQTLRQLGFDSKDMLKHPYLPDAWIACIEDRGTYRVQWLSSEGVISSVFVKHLE